jgi:hypothetical protein
MVWFLFRKGMPETCNAPMHETNDMKSEHAEHMSIRNICHCEVGKRRAQQRSGERRVLMCRYGTNGRDIHLVDRVWASSSSPEQDPPVQQHLHSSDDSLASASLRGGLRERRW